ATPGRRAWCRGGLVRARHRHARQEHPPQARARPEKPALHPHGVRHRVQVRGAMIPRWQRRHRPPWWPDNEPWPPSDSRARWGRGRSRFVRRVGCLFAALLFLSAIGGASLLSMVLGRTGLIGAPDQVSLWTVAGAAAFAVLIVAFIGAMRRVAFPLGEIV